MTIAELANRIPFTMSLHITQDALKGWSSSRYQNKELVIGCESHTKRKTKRYFYRDDQKRPKVYTSLVGLLDGEPSVRQQAEMLYGKEPQP